jgi:Uma2 family endonuclease
MATAEKLLTAEEYARMPDNGQPTELVRGRIITLNPPVPYHGFVCGKVYVLVFQYVTGHGLGWVMSNDSGVITERDPDTVRGADVAYYSYSRIPKAGLPKESYVKAVPELVFEILSPSDRWSKVHIKVGEYLAAGVNVVCVVDSAKQRIHVFTEEQPPRLVAADEELTLPEVFPDFHVPVSEFFS